MADAGYGEDEENLKEVKDLRRSTRLSKQGPLADSNKGKKAKAGRRRHVLRKAKERKMLAGYQRMHLLLPRPRIGLGLTKRRIMLLKR